MKSRGSSIYSTMKQMRNPLFPLATRSHFMGMAVLLAAFICWATSLHAQSSDTLSVEVHDSIAMLLQGGREGFDPYEEAPVTRRKMLAIGHTLILDTYLSPEQYRGTSLSFLSHTVYHKSGTPFSCEISHRGEVAKAAPRSQDGNELSGMYTFNYGWHYHWRLLEGRLRIKAGGLLDAQIGFLYNTRNSNNPAQAKVALHIMPSVTASYSFIFHGRHYLLRYEVATPLAGLMFSPRYGQSYYEIFNKGNYDRNIVPTTFIATPSLRQMLTFDIPLGKSTFTVGYLGDYRQAAVNALKQHTYTHAFLLGYVKRFSIKR